MCLHTFLSSNISCFTFRGLYNRWYFNIFSDHENPSLNLTSGTLTPKAGETVIFTCAAESNEGAPTYTWQLNGSPLSGNQATFALPNISKDSPGSYTCSTTVSGDTKTSEALQLNLRSKLS